MSGISKSQVSRLCAEIDERVTAFLDRPIEGDWPYLWLDATYVKVRQNGRIVSVAVIVAVGVNTDGRREVLGMDIGPSEAETFWTEFLRKLARRGLRGREARHLRRPRGPQGRDREGAQRHLAALPRGAVEEAGVAEIYPAAGACRPHARSADGRGRTTVDLHKPTRSARSRTARRAAASRLRLIAAAVRKAWMRMFWRPRRTARARPCQVFASPWKPSERQRWRW